MVMGLDAPFDRARTAGAATIKEPTDTEYGHRRYRAADPEGHEWCFAQDIRRPRLARSTTRERVAA
jgi:uncharacterized glyoxalase superfamily protein PhnB